jgi:hypothetical protein
MTIFDEQAAGHARPEREDVNRHITAGKLPSG